MTPQGIFRRQAALTIAVLAAACALAPTAGAKIADAVTRSEAGHYVQGEAIVRFEPGTTGADRRAARREADVDFDETLEIPRAEIVEVSGSVEVAVRRLEGQPGVAYAQPNTAMRRWLSIRRTTLSSTDSGASRTPRLQIQG